MVYPWLFSKQSSKLQECTFMSEEAVKLSGWHSKDAVLSWERNEKYQFKEDIECSRSMLLLEDGGKWKIEWFGRRRGGEGEVSEGEAYPSEVVALGTTRLERGKVITLQEMSRGVHPSPAFGSFPNLEALVIEESNAEEMDEKHFCT
ncbi:hypothetical protein S83_041739, partial [Arachis hypogaea]